MNRGQTGNRLSLCLNACGQEWGAYMTDLTPPPPDTFPFFWRARQATPSYIDLPEPLRGQVQAAVLAAHERVCANAR